MVWVYAYQKFLKRKGFLIWFSTKKVLMSMSKFALKKVSLCSFTKSVFQTSQVWVQIEWGLDRSVCILVGSNRKNFWSGFSTLWVQIEWGLEQECMHTSRFWNRKNFWSGFSTLEEECKHSRRKVLKQTESFILVFYEKSIYVDVKFSVQKVSICSFTKSVFKSSQGLVQMEWGLE